MTFVSGPKVTGLDASMMIDGAFLCLCPPRARPVDRLWSALGRIAETFSPAACANYVAAADHDPD